MKGLKKIVTVMLAVVMTLGLAACGEKELDASGYVKSCLDAAYHGEYEEYAKFLNISVEEAEKDMNEDLDAQVEAEFEGMDGITDDVKESYKAKVEEIQKLAKYEVKDAEKQDDGSYVVTVAFFPSDVYQTLEQHSADVADEKLEQGLDASDAEVFGEILMESLQRSIDGNTYGEEVTQTVTVEKDEDGTYSVPDAQMQAIADVMFPQ